MAVNAREKVNQLWLLTVVQTHKIIDIGNMSVKAKKPWRNAKYK